MPAESVSRCLLCAYFLMVSFLPAFRALLACTRRVATGVPTSTVDDPHRHSRVLAELAVVAIANFLSEFGQLDRG